MGYGLGVFLLAVGLGSFFIIGVRSLQENLVAEFDEFETQFAAALKSRN